MPGNWSSTRSWKSLPPPNEAPLGVVAWQDYLRWQDGDRDIAQRINTLIEDTRRSPFRGIGKPEPLKGGLAGWWSRRITDEHRLVYRVAGKGGDQQLEIVSCRFHYR